jgi:hypothetical protein
MLLNKEFVSVTFRNGWREGLWTYLWGRIADRFGKEAFKVPSRSFLSLSKARIFVAEPSQSNEV